MPSQSALGPGWPSPLRPGKPPKPATIRVISPSVGGVSGGGWRFATNHAACHSSGAKTTSHAVLELGGPCVPLEEVRGHYGDLQITDTPHGHSLDEKTSYTAYLPWGELSFGFAERNPDCLASIVFEPKKGGM